MINIIERFFPQSLESIDLCQNGNSYFREESNIFFKNMVLHHGVTFR